jgi:DNA-binding NarL/FixJ family response regulator
VCSGAEAMAQLSKVAPQVALVDLGLPDISGVELIRRIAAACPNLPIVVLTVCTEDAQILEAFRAGARGYLFKEDLGRDLVPALDEALAGGAPMSRPVARLVLEQLREAEVTERPSAPPLPALTDRERQVVEQLARGLSYELVGTVLGISTNTVRTYIRTIYEKLCVCSRTEAVVVALRLGLVASD